MDIIPLVVSVMIVGFIIYWCIRCCCTKSTQGAVISTSPIIITSEVHRVNPGTTQSYPPPQPGTIIQGHMTGTAAYPVAYPAQNPAPYPPQPYMQHYPLQQSAAPSSMPPPPQNSSVQFPALPTQMHAPAPPTSMASAPPPMAGAAMMNPPSYDQVVTGDAYQPQAPYNPNFKG